VLKVLILHGWHGSDIPHWQGWLAQQLVLDNCIVAFPKLSDNRFPDKERWVDEALSVMETLNPDVVVCHSLGCTLWLHLCSHLTHSVKKLLLCAPPRDHGDTPEITSFFPVASVDDLHADIKILVVSDNDPYISIDEAHEFACKLNVPMEILHDAGHINSASGFGPWPWVKEWVLV